MKNDDFMNRAPFTGFKNSNKTKHEFDSGNFIIRIETENRLGMTQNGHVEIVQKGEIGKEIWSGKLDAFLELVRLGLFSASKADLM